MLYRRLIAMDIVYQLHPRRWRIDIVHGQMCAFSAPELSRSRFLGVALESAGGTTDMGVGGLRVPQSV